MKLSPYPKGAFLYKIPSDAEVAQYHPEGERVFIHTGYITGDGYGVLIGWHNHKLCHSTEHGNFQWGGEVRPATEAEIDEFMTKLMHQEIIGPY